MNNMSDNVIKTKSKHEPTLGSDMEIFAMKWDKVRLFEVGFYVVYEGNIMNFSEYFLLNH